MSKLTTKQALFVDNYLANGGNGTAAAKAAGYKGNERTLAQTASENLRKPDIIKVINEQQMGLKQKTRTTAEAKRAKLWDIVQAVTQFERDEESGRPIRMLDARVAVSAIAELNKMDGDHATIKTETKSVNANLNYDINRSATPEMAAKAYLDLING